MGNNYNIGWKVYILKHEGSGICNKFYIFWHRAKWDDESVPRTPVSLGRWLVVEAFFCGAAVGVQEAVSGSEGRKQHLMQYNSYRAQSNAEWQEANSQRSYCMIPFIYHSWNKIMKMEKRLVVAQD